ncbi:uncharacterized protein NFIA_048730 [Aspergillus fischeri NRRL 181]|uniref:Polymerase nucleotidyl transferase domain-containing protein n=1 Tax=Neosartorya fischeri (strain ATCC 1020 / DSM 3700 / CBS 544.65 / FGSC A1164 / JCM 1740 / NRRL 181 / WB 181) TaxID=331117 RepID=A1DL65_NEOFI|nr:uncharacterized protein NFIA_048730 [Aspergillus fischeri NRRL 181]EAW15536.1 hypothetical protein NFIA_048730 [Aspergillus fischeri NRRL 181]
MAGLSDNVLRAALRAAAMALILSLQAMPELRGVHVAIIGGLAVQHYVGNRRRTSDVDVLLFSPDYSIDTRRIRKELVSRFSHLFMECADPLFFKYRHGDSTHLVQVDLIPQYLVCFGAAVRQTRLN